MTEVLSREQILGLDLAHEDLEVPAWGRTVRIRELTLAERDLLEVEVLRERATGGNLRARLLVRACTEPETGKRIFTDADAGALSRLGSAIVQPLFLAALRVSGLTEKEADALGKGSAGEEPAGSRSSSPSASG